METVTKQPTTELLAVRAIGETLTVSSVDFAGGLGIQHKNLLETIRTHQAAIEASFGRIAFETQTLKKDSAFETRNLPTKRSTKPLTVAYLTEDQALFVGTLGRNSARVVAFKATLVRSFSEARRQLREAAQLLMPTDHLRQHDQRIHQLERQINLLLFAQQQAATTLLNLPRSAVPVPLEATRMKVQRLVNAYCGAKNIKQQDVWRQVYQSLYYRYQINIRAHKRSERESWLDVIDRSGHMEKIYAIVSQELIP